MRDAHCTALPIAPMGDHRQSGQATIVYEAGDGFDQQIKTVVELVKKAFLYSMVGPSRGITLVHPCVLPIRWLLLTAS